MFDLLKLTLWQKQTKLAHFQFFGARVRLHFFFAWCVVESSLVAVACHCRQACQVTRDVWHDMCSFACYLSRQHSIAKANQGTLLGKWDVRDSYLPIL